MYVFPHPLTIDPSGLGRCRLIVPSEWKVSHGDLKKIGTLNRTVASTSLVSYSIHLDGVTKASKNTTRGATLAWFEPSTFSSTDSLGASQSQLQLSALRTDGNPWFGGVLCCVKCFDHFVDVVGDLIERRLSIR